MPPFLVFTSGTVTSCLDIESVKQLHARATLIAASPIDLLASARAYTPEGTIYGLVSKLLSPQLAKSLSPNNDLYNNPHAWFTALRRVAKTLAVGKKKETLNMNTSTPHTAEAMPEVKASAAKKFTYKQVEHKVIHLLTTTNPKRPNTAAFANFALLIQHGPMTVAEFFKKGGRLSDVKCDVERGYAELRDAALASKVQE